MNDLYKQGYVAAQDVDDLKTAMSVQSTAVETAKGQVLSATAALNAASAQKRAADPCGPFANTAYLARRCAMSIRKLWKRLVIPFTMLAVALAAAADTAYLRPAEVGTFNGRSWSGITLGASTQKALKRLYKTGRSDYEHALLISQPKGSPLRIHALCSGKEQPVSEVILSFPNGGPELSTLAASIGDAPKAFYPRTRYEDWRLTVWPDRGIVAFVLSTPAGAQAPVIALARPEEAARLTTFFSPNPTPVSRYVDPHADEPKVMGFGRVYVYYSVRGVRVNEDRERLFWEERMRHATAGGAMRYEVGAAGSYTATVTASYDPKKGGNVSASCKITGSGPYGPVSGEGYASGSLSKGRDRPEIASTSAYTRAFSDAMRQAERDFETNMAKSGPPPIESFRLADWAGLIEQMRGMPAS
jgi:hypothetical protein